MYEQVGDFYVSRGPPTVPLKQILHNAVFCPKIRVMRGPSVYHKHFRPFFYKAGEKSSDGISDRSFRFTKVEQAHS